jgi:hypothetical protein
MGTTSAALQANSGVRIGVSMVIEGISYVFSTARDAADVLGVANAWGSSDAAAMQDFFDTTLVLGGLSVSWDFAQSISPWKPFTEPGTLKVSIAPAPEVNSVDIGASVFKRAGTNAETTITVALDQDDTTINCARVDDFAASGTLYAGCETIAYSSRDTGADTFTVSTRGKFAGVATESGARFSRTHQPASTTQYALPPLIGTEPRVWVGRWAQVWIHRIVDDAWDLVQLDQSAAHLAFAGRVVGVEDADGSTWFTLEDTRRKIYETVLLRDQFKGRLAEGYFLQTGDAFGISTKRQVSGGSFTVGTGNDLIVVAGAPASANEVQTGRYTSTQLADVLNEWFQTERGAGRILFNINYQGAVDTGSGIRASMSYSDATSTANLYRLVTLTSSGSAAFAIQQGGWQGGGGTVQFDGNTASDSVTSPRSPMRVNLSGALGQVYTGMTIDDPQGTWISQAATLPAGFQVPGNLIDGILKIGDYGYMRVGRVSDTSFRFTFGGVDRLFPDGGILDDEINLTLDDPETVEVSQVLLMESTFQTLLLQILQSTGTSNFNSTYDDLTEQISCSIPYSLFASDFATKVGLLNEADAPVCCYIDKATRFGELFESEFILRRCFLVMSGGLLDIGTWATPTSAYATVTLTESSKASPVGTVDKNRSAMQEDDSSFYNVVKINYDLRLDGTYGSHLVLVDATSIRSHGERAFTVNARNTFGTGAGISPIQALVASFSGFFQVTSKPWLVIKRSIDFNKFLETTPGTVLVLTDGYIRDPATGLRYSHMTSAGGLSGYPGMVIGHSFDWGGVEIGGDGGENVVRKPGGEVSIMLSPQRTQAAYVPCAQFAGTNYNAGTRVCAVEQHEHSEASEAVDASHFAAGDEVLVVEIDPQTAASPLSWSDVIATVSGSNITLTTGLAGIDTAKTYRIIYDGYSTVGSGQRVKIYQADDADMLIADTQQPYGFSFFGSSQSRTVTLSTPTEVPARHATVAYGDGKPLDVGYERDAVRLANNAWNYKYARQQPTMNAEVRNYTGSGTYQVVDVRPIFLGVQQFTAGRTRSLTVAPRIRSTDGATANCRVTLARRPPQGASRNDVTRLSPYQEYVFTTTSTTANIPTAQALDIKHCKLEEGTLGGVGWLIVEVNSKCEFTGMARCVLGAVS